VRFILVDRILGIEKGREGSFLKNVSQSEDYFTDHFPESPIMPGVLILESFDQASQFLVASSHGFTRYPELKQVLRVTFRHYVLPGDQLQIYLNIASEDNEKIVINASAKVHEKIAAEATLLFNLVPEGCDPEAKAHCKRLEHFYDLLSADPLGRAWEGLIGHF